MDGRFYELLCNDANFCHALGRMTLAASRFESDLREFLRLNGVDIPADRATFGTLVAALRKNDLLSDNGDSVLRDLTRQRNYLTHSLFDLFSGRIPETMLPRSNLVPMDVEVFSEKVSQLEENLIGLSRIAEKEIACGRPRGADKWLLFRP